MIKTTDEILKPIFLKKLDQYQDVLDDKNISPEQLAELLGAEGFDKHMVLRRTKGEIERRRNVELEREYLKNISGLLRASSIPSQTPMRSFFENNKYSQP